MFSAGDGGVDGGLGNHVAVQLDGNHLADVCGSGLGKGIRAFVIELKLHNGLTFQIAHLRLLDRGAVHDDFAVGGLEFQLCRLADDVQDLVGIVHIRDFDADAVGALLRDRSFRKALAGQTAAEHRHGARQQACVIFLTLIHCKVNGRNAAAQIQSLRNTRHKGLDFQRADVQPEDGQ